MRPEGRQQAAGIPRSGHSGRMDRTAAGVGV